MLDRIKEEVDSAQTRLRDVSSRIQSQRAELVRNARHRVHLARGEGQERIWKLEHQALDLVDDVLDRADDLPGSSRVREPIERIVQQRRDAALSNPVEDYDGLNARKAAAAVRTLSWVELLRLERYEADRKNRKTVLEAIERRRVVLNKPPYVESNAA
jgi:hypothetical protein